MNNSNTQLKNKIKRCNINVKYLQTRIINALKSTAYDKINKIKFNNESSLFIGTGGSYAAAYFSSKVINEIYGINTYPMLPRDVLYRNNKNISSVFLFSYSGTTNDIINSVKNIDTNKKYIITKGTYNKINKETKIFKDNVISYKTPNNKTREKGFLSFEGAVAPSSIFLKKYLISIKYDIDCESFIIKRIKYWDKYFNNLFEINKNYYKKLFTKENYIHIFSGDYTTTAGIDLESKITESGIFNSIVHEKKNFSHGRFINYENLNNKISIYFKQNKNDQYENILINYLDTNKTIIIESEYNGLICEFDLLLASQYLIYYIANLINIDMSKPEYTSEALDIYHYKGDL